MRRWILFLVIAIPLGAIAQQELHTEPPLGQVLLSLYSPHGKTMRIVPGRQPWRSPLWVDHQKIGTILPGQFLTLRLSAGDHSLAGFSAWGHESTIDTVISLHVGKRYFMRLIGDSKAVAGFGSAHYIAEEVSCQEAYPEAAALEPVKLKHIEKSSLEYVARESYFPECGK
jgi:hypothetical protein